MIKQIVTFTHILQFIVHLWFMYSCVVGFQYGKTFKMMIWDQFKYLTNFSNWMMFAYLIPFIYYDLISKPNQKIQDRYPKLAHTLFQMMNPVIFLVMASYQTMIFIDPKLLLTNDFKPTEWQMVLLFYLHAGNFLLMQVEYILYTHPKISKKNLIFSFIIYLVTYLGIYGIYFVVEGEHVYGFQNMLGVKEVVAMYVVQFLSLFAIDLAYHSVIHSAQFQKIVLENVLKKYKIE